MEKIRIGTRGSKLAVWQSNFIAEKLRATYPTIEVEIVKVITKGDKILNSPLSKVGGKGLFTKELEMQMLEGQIDLAVHSLKDVPAEILENFTIAAVTKRENPFDAFVSNKYKNFQELPMGAMIGTSSLRRSAQILAARPDLKIKNLRGNVDTRLHKLDNGEFDAIILAVAGLKRLGHENRIKEILPTSLMLPAVGQGALAIETLKDNAELNKFINFLDDTSTHSAVKAERAFLKVVEGGCQVPIGVYANILNQTITVEALIASLDGKKIIRDKISGIVDDNEIIGETLANNLLAKGGKEILTSI